MKKLTVAALAALTLTVATQAQNITIGAGIINNNKAGKVALNNLKVGSYITVNSYVTTNKDLTTEALINYPAVKGMQVGLGVSGENVDYTATTTVPIYNAGGNLEGTTTTNFDSTKLIIAPYATIRLQTTYVTPYVKASNKFLKAGAQANLIKFNENLTTGISLEYAKFYDTDLKNANKDENVNVLFTTTYKF